MKFIPKPGQIDYTRKKSAPVINCVVKYQDKVLILKRSKKMAGHTRVSRYYNQ
ncbi:hypothetical protein L6279_04270 [Candidatus Parcubacteria bacterium]|nr:hypothetical protein [Candidatus Parcubacteria bacterium]